MTGKFALGGLVLVIVAVGIPLAPAEAQYRQYRNERETRQCQTTAGFGGVRLPRADRSRGIQTRNCRIELRCPGIRDNRACFRVGKECEPWPGICSSR